MAGASRVTTSRAASQTRALDTSPTTVVAAVGVTERGPIGSETLATSFAEYQRVYGGFTANSADMDLAAKAFFDEGGKVLHVVRVVHCTDASDPTTKTSAASTLSLQTATPAATSGAASSSAGPWSVANSATLVVKIDGGANQTLTFTGAPAARESAAAGSGFVLSSGQTLQISINGGATITKTFNASEFVSIGAATAAEVMTALNAFFASLSAGAVATVTNVNHVTITSNRSGTSSGVNVIGGTANASLLFTTGNQAGTGNVANLAAVTATEVAGLLGALPLTGASAAVVSGAVKISSLSTGTSSSVQIVSSGTANLGFDNAIHGGIAAVAQATLRVDARYDGAYGNALSVQIAPATNGQSDHFNLYVIRAGVVTERFVNLSLDSARADYAVTVVNSGSGTQLASNLISVADLNATVPSPGDLPPAGTYGPLAGGNDGLVGLADADFTGGTGTHGSLGFRVLDTVEDLSILIVPGRATAAVHNGAITYCEVNRGGLSFAVLDPPAGNTVAQIRTYVSSTAAIKELSELAAIYYPRILVDNPSTAAFGAASSLLAPPSGSIAGLYARIDASKDGGAFENPASIEIGFLRTARGLESDEVKDETKRGLLFDDRINPIMSKKGFPIFVDGARTLRSLGAFPSVGESRGVLFLQQTIGSALDPKRNRNNRPRLRNEIRMLVEEFLRRLTKKECFASSKDVEAWYFDIGDALNSAAEQAAGNVNARLGVALSKPAEFINIVFAPFAVSAKEQFAAA